VPAPPTVVWERVASFEGVNDELMPIVRMTYTTQGSVWEQESFCSTDPALADYGAVFVKFTLKSAKPDRQMPPKVRPERQSLIPHAATLEKFGFELEEFGGDAVRLSAVPAVLDQTECEAAIRALAGDLEGLDRGSRVEEALRRIAATMACHAAVKANYPLTMEKMRYILEELRRTAYSSVCPHGRPVVLRITKREIEKNFQRI